MATSSAASNAENSVKKVYTTVIEEVLANVRESFLDEGYDEQLLQEMKQMWESKLNASRAVNTNDELLLGSSSTSQKQSQQQQRIEPSRNSNSSAFNVTNLLGNNSSKQHQQQQIDSATSTAFQNLPKNLYPNSGSNQKKSNHQMASKQQLDGGGIDGSSSDDDDDEIGAEEIGDDEDDKETSNDEHGGEYEGKEDPDPLNSGDDLTGPDSDNSNSEIFETDNVIVCQYDKITRIKNRWKFHLKDGIMNINGKDYLFSKATGEAEW